MELLAFAVVGLLITGTLFLFVLPVKLSAVALGAKRTGFWWCFLALVISNIFHALGLLVPVLGTIAAWVFCAVGFAWILDTTFLRGLGISLLQMVLFWVLIALGAGVLLTFGVAVPMIMGVAL